MYWAPVFLKYHTNSSLETFTPSLPVHSMAETFKLLSISQPYKTHGWKVSLILNRVAAQWIFLLSREGLLVANVNWRTAKPSVYDKKICDLGFP